ncbi:UMTA methyltransferase family protein [Colletotrichum tofieldiae]|uniref:UMTA methyltransferase family protein n=1 Tax=Colletotrichum tofieldiae TaxID=708197 RepID=A0A166WPS6_9PEZI|nr:UMTA methyltransferase family protein [Colletotrichum tofieldiae]
MTLRASGSTAERLGEKKKGHLKPGCWGESHDVNSEFHSDDGTHRRARYGEMDVRVFRDLPGDGPRHERDTKARGHGSRRRRIKAPLGPWAKEQHHRDVGMMNLILTTDGLEALSLKLFFGLLGRTQAEIVVELALVRKELKSSTFHAMFDMWNPLKVESESN